MKYRLKIEPQALTDIQEITIRYNNIQQGLGNRFQKTVIFQIDKLPKNPHVYGIRYNEIRCVLVNKYPYMVHFFVNEETKVIEILAVISTNRNPRIWREKTKSN